MNPLNRIIALISFLMIFYTVPNFSQSQFEGKIVFEVSDQETSPQQINYLVKGDWFRIEVPQAATGSGAMIYNQKNKTMTMIMPQQKMYMEMPLDMSEKVQKEDVGPGYFKKTGESKNINGYDCDKFIFKDEEGEGVAWMTKELGGFMFFNNPNERSSQSGWEDAVMAEGYFPMIVKIKDSSGAAKTAFKVTKIEPKTLDMSLFKPPAGFKKLDMGNMMQKHK